MNDKARLKEINRDISSLTAEKRIVENRMRARKSASNIERLGLTLADVELSMGDEKPYFSIVYELRNWMRAYSVKEYYEWCDWVYSYTELVSDRAMTEICKLQDLK